MRSLVCLTYLSGERGQIRESEIQWERLIWVEKTVTNHCDFRILTRECFSDCNCGFFHRWIGLIFGQQFLHAWYFKLFGWIGKKISIERDKCFTLSALYFGVLSSCLYCTNWGFVLIWWFVAQFSALIGDSFVSSLIIVELFLWYERPIVFILALRGFLCLFFS